MLVIATHNTGKVREFQALLNPLGKFLVGLSCFPDVPHVEETGGSFEENALLKARSYARLLHHWVLSEDSGLEVPALQGAPGVLSARYSGPGATDEANNQKLLNALQNVSPERRAAYYKSVIVLAGEDDKNTIITCGICHGYIANAPRGNQGFGYDPLFYTPALGKTFGEISLEMKNSISHRAKAVHELIKKLSGTSHPLGRVYNYCESVA